MLKALAVVLTLLIGAFLQTASAEGVSAKDRFTQLRAEVAQEDSNLLAEASSAKVSELVRDLFQGQLRLEGRPEIDFECDDQPQCFSSGSVFYRAISRHMRDAIPAGKMLLCGGDFNFMNRGEVRFGFEAKEASDASTSIHYDILCIYDETGEPYFKGNPWGQAVYDSKRAWFSITNESKNSNSLR